MDDFFRCKDCKHDLGKCLGVSRRGRHNNCFEPKVMTNADRIRSMSDEELAEFIKNIKVRAALCKAVKNNDAFEELCSAEWLKQPAE